MIFGTIIGVWFILYGISIVFKNVNKITDKIKLNNEESPQNDNDKAE